MAILHANPKEVPDCAIANLPHCCCHPKKSARPKAPQARAPYSSTTNPPIGAPMAIPNATDDRCNANAHPCNVGASFAKSVSMPLCLDIKGNIHGALPCHVMMCNGPPLRNGGRCCSCCRWGGFPRNLGEWRQFRDARDGFPGEGSRSITRSQILRICAVFIVFARDFFILLCAR